MSVLYGTKLDLPFVVSSSEIGIHTLKEEEAKDLPWYLDIVTGKWVIDVAKGTYNLGKDLLTGKLIVDIYKHPVQALEQAGVIASSFIPVVGPGLAGAAQIGLQASTGQRVTGADIVMGTIGATQSIIRGSKNFLSYKDTRNLDSLKNITNKNISESRFNEGMASDIQDLMNKETLPTTFNPNVTDRWAQLNELQKTYSRQQYANTQVAQTFGGAFNELKEARPSIFKNQSIKMNEILEKHYQQSIDYINKVNSQYYRVETGSAALNKVIADSLNKQMDITGNYIRKEMASAMSDFKEFNTIQSTVRIGEGENDINDELKRNLREKGMSEEEISSLFGLLRNSDKASATLYDYLKGKGWEDLEIANLANRLKGRRIHGSIVDGQVHYTKQRMSIGDIRRHIKRIGSSEKQEKLIEGLKLLTDTGDIAQLPIEVAFNKIKRAFKRESKEIESSMAKYMPRTLTAVKKVEKIREMFAKTGGVLCDSDVIIGYKVLERTALKSLVMVSFYPDATGAKHETWNGVATKNFGGKKPVIIMASQKQLTRLRLNGMRYYLDNFAISRGGAIDAGMFAGINFGDAARLMPFMKSETLKNAIRLGIIASKAKQEVGELGFWSKEWIDAISDKFKQKLNNRMRRALMHKVLGAKGAKVERVITQAAKSGGSATIMSQATRMGRRQVSKRNSDYRKYKSSVRTVRQVNRIARGFK